MVDVELCKKKKKSMHIICSWTLRRYSASSWMNKQAEADLEVPQTTA